MAAIYLWLNAALYTLFAILCTINLSGTSAALGYRSLNASGTSEYLTIYGGLQLGLAALFAWTAYHGELHRTGIVLAILFYLPIVAFRWISIARVWPVETMTIGVGVLEVAMLAGAVAIWWLQRGAL